MKPSHRPLISISLCLAGLYACGSDSEPAAISGSGGELRCSHDVLEPDLESQPLAGPAIDPATGKLRLTPGQHFIVSSTYGVPIPGPNGEPITERYGRLFAAVEQQLRDQPGLLALQLSSSPRCGSGRTLAIWDSEESMYAFVTSPAHLEAMTSVHDVLQPGYAVTHWEANTPDAMTLQEATHQLALSQARE